MVDRTTARATPRPEGSPGLGVVVVARRLYENGGIRSTLRLVQQRPRAPGRAAADADRERGPDPGGRRPVYPTAPGARLRRVLVLGVLRVARLAADADVVVSAQHHGYGLMVARVAAWLTRRPLLVIVRSAPQQAIDRWVRPRRRAMTRYAHRSADRVGCITPGLVPSVLAMGVRPSRISVALNGVEVDRIQLAGRAGTPALPEGPGR